jgi:alkane 1-monooxygenase
MFTPLAFFPFLSFALLPVLGWQLGVLWLTPVLLLTAMPLADWLFGRVTTNADAAREARIAANPFWFDLPLYVYCVLHVGLIIWGAWLAPQLAQQGNWLGVFWLAMSVGSVTGAQGINIAHELGHRRGAFHRFLSQLLLVWVSYGHFYVEHNRGHHVRVATHDDPASARFGETFFAFWRRTVTYSFLDAWQLEAVRLKRSGKPLWHGSNRLFWLVGSTLAIAGALTTVWGLAALGYFVVQSIMAFSLLEAVNYVEHYGLTRNRLPDGVATGQPRFERVRPVHSWNDAHVVSNAYLFNLQRHSDHHANPSVPYPLLKHHEEAPQLPAGYATMVMLAHCPPLFFKIMNPRVEAWRAARAAETSASPSPVHVAMPGGATA